MLKDTSIFTQTFSTHLRAIANAGDVTDAITILNSLNASNAPVTSATNALHTSHGVLAVVAVIFVVLFLRVRGKVSYFQLVVEDQIKDLEGLTLRAFKDRPSNVLKLRIS